MTIGKFSCLRLVRRADVAMEPVPMLTFWLSQFINASRPSKCLSRIGDKKPDFAVKVRRLLPQKSAKERDVVGHRRQESQTQNTTGEVVDFVHTLTKINSVSRSKKVDAPRPRTVHAISRDEIQLYR